ncbi:prim-pol domain-containing protein [Epithele typhae]|uniref:prim-pol domain-containing protein n=1 Tax=Epithele typhae TaxID=378194 RepID=UPI00200852C4|nr:prim-pol domain-containing protein [Epithele typhae]KAH9916996.1 prim-pol domain-containing protein [Epithele typhae]
MSKPQADSVTEDIMLAFYRRLYPFKSLFAWLNHEHAPTKMFTNREFAFTLHNEAYLRYQSFANAEEMKKQVCAQVPARFEIGPVYSARPRDKKTVRPALFFPQLRELVVDIDMTDYDSIRTCCKGADICRRCWGFIAAAVRVLDSGIRDQFGYKHLLWVYSGRRGIHLWISDREAMELTDDQRKALVGWMTVIAGGDMMSKKVNVRPPGKPLPQSIAQACKVLTPVFEELILRDQKVFDSEKGWKDLLTLLPSEVAAELEMVWQKSPSDGPDEADEEPRSSEDKWQDVKDSAAPARAKKYNAKGMAGIMTAAMEDIVLQYTYPRLDAEVSKHRNHLLKAPFCIHPKTGRVCVPVDPRKVDRFRLEDVPTVHQLLRELDQNVVPQASEASSGEHHSDWERTSLKKYVDMLDQHVLGLMEETRKVKQQMDMSW